MTLVHPHWLAMAERCKFHADEMAAVIADLIDRMNDVLALWLAHLSLISSPSAITKRETSRNR